MNGWRNGQSVMTMSDMTVRTILDETIGTARAAEIAGVDVQTVRRHIREGKLPAYKVGNKTRLYEREVRELYVRIEPVVPGGQ